MIPITAALKAHLATPYATTCTLWLGTQVNGTVIGFTDHDQDITFAATATGTASFSGTTMTVVTSTTGPFAVGQTVSGAGISAGVTILSLGTGTGGPGTYTLSSSVGSISTEAVYAGVPRLFHALVGFTRTDIASGSDLSVDNLEVDGILSSPSITEADLNAGLWDYAAVKISLINWADLTMGEVVLRQGNLGEVSLAVGKFSFKAELRGLTQAYSRSLGSLTSPACRNTLGDDTCTVNLVPLTVTSTLTGVSTDGITLYDTARTEPGPTGTVAITGITQANPGIVTTASALSLANGAPITISGVVGMVQVNTTTLFRNPSGSTFQLGVDTTGFPAYVSGGIVTPLGSATGYFDFGLITFTSGACNGLSMEVRSYVPGQITLALPMPYALAPGDGYKMQPGCDKSFSTCKTRYSNGVNFNGEPYLPGLDKMMQVGKQ